MAASVIFAITSRCADSLNYMMLNDRQFDRASKQLLKRGYAFGMGKTSAHPDHRAMADAVRKAVLEGPGITDVTLRQRVAQRASGGQALESPYDDLVQRIGEAAHQVTDQQVVNIVEEIDSERAAYELIVTAAVGAGFHRWQQGLEVLNEARHETT